MSSQEEQQFDKATKEILVKLVTALLCDKPKDPVKLLILFNLFFLGALHLLVLA
jgi:hypothetical protein